MGDHTSTDAPRRFPAQDGRVPWSRDRVLWLLLFLALAVRLVHVSAPILGRHSWRQADTAAMARNFHENGYRFAYPQIDWAGAAEGNCETEFPLYPYLAANLYRLTGVWEGWGRLVSALCSLVTLVCIHALIREAGGRKTALWSLGFLAFLPLNVYYSRTFMPESMMLAGSALGVYAFSRWTATESRRWWMLSLLGVTLACLLKITSFYLGLPLLFLAWYRWGARALRRPALWLYAIVLIGIVAAWYAHAYRVGQQSGITFGIWAYGSDKWGRWDLLLTWNFWNSILFRSLAERHLTWAAVPLLLVGLVLPRRDPRERLFDGWLLAVMAYFMIAQRGNLVHEYYQLPFMLPASFYLGRACAWGLDAGRKTVIRGLVTVLAVGILGLSAVRLVDYLRREDPSRSWQAELAGEIRRETPPAARGVFVDESDPTLMYLAHRKGWHALPGKLTADWLSARTAEGALFVAGRAADLPAWLRERDDAHRAVSTAGGELLVIPLVRSGS